VAPATFNAANEVAVAAFLEKRIGFPSIAHTIEHSLKSMKNREPMDLEDLLAADAEARRIASAQANSLSIS
jgi:1-deoxy-D-xylulose-5-phosphate reductoisomerase